MNVYNAIAEVMGKLSKEGISKDRKNQQQNYAFRGIDDIFNTLAPMLSSAKLLILPRVLNRQVTERETKNGGALFYVVLDVEFDIVSAEDGSKHVVRVCGEAMDSADKATNKAMSAAFKYACLQTFCIPTEGDNDADSTTHEVVAKPRPTLAAKPQMRSGGRTPSEIEIAAKSVQIALSQGLRDNLWEIHQAFNQTPEDYSRLGDALETKDKNLFKDIIFEMQAEKRAIPSANGRTSGYAA